MSGFRTPPPPPSPGRSGSFGVVVIPAPAQGRGAWHGNFPQGGDELVDLVLVGGDVFLRERSGEIFVDFVAEEACPRDLRGRSEGDHEVPNESTSDKGI